MNTVQTRTPRRSAAQWRILVEQQAGSGLEPHAFCAAEGLSLAIFRRWKRHHARPGQMPARYQPLFAELTHPAEPLRPLSQAGCSDWDVELELGPGLFLRISRCQPVSIPVEYPPYSQ